MAAAPERAAPEAAGELSAAHCEAIADLPGGGAALFAAAPDFCLGRAWFDTLIAAGMAPGSRASFCVLGRAGQAIALLPLRLEADGRPGSLSNLYTCLYRPLIAAPDPAGAIARRLGGELGRLCARHRPVRIDCLPPEWPGLDAFVAGLRAAGAAVRRFDQFGNWHEPVAGLRWPEYLAARPGNLREVLRRRGRGAALRYEILSQPQEAPRAAAIYEAVYRQSWKEPEPFPQFHAGLMRAAADEGALRLGVCWRAETPVAVQLWTLAHGRARVMKLAHDEAHKALSPGTLLTAQMIARLFEEGIEEIDFGRGDDPYKRLWAGARRQRIGLLVVDPRRPDGLSALLRHDLGRAVRAARRRFAREAASARA